MANIETFKINWELVLSLKEMFSTRTLKCGITPTRKEGLSENKLVTLLDVAKSKQE